MEKQYFILIIIAGMCIPFVIMYLSNKRTKQLQKEYESPSMLSKAPEIKDELLNKDYALIADQLKGLPIRAFTQCDYLQSVSSKAGDAAVAAAKTIGLGLLGVKVRHTQVDHVAYFALVNDDLHYIYFEEGEVNEHLIFGRDRLDNAQVKEMSNTDKTSNLFKTIGKSGSKQLSIKVDDQIINFMVHGTIIRAPYLQVDVTQMFDKSKRTQSLTGKNRLMAIHFANELKATYPNLKLA